MMQKYYENTKNASIFVDKQIYNLNITDAIYVKLPPVPYPSASEFSHFAAAFHVDFVAEVLLVQL